ncbi:MAG: HD-GYP domain-containing protein [Firmicutes bacterium]|nr:HD-GYP domain-containing protein [Bacillota bacterium]
MIALLVSRIAAIAIAAAAAFSAGLVTFLKGQIVYPETSASIGILFIAVICALALYLVVGAFSSAVTKKEQAEERASRLQEVFLGVISSLSRVLDARDPHTAQHSQNVAEYALAIAKEMGLSVSQRETIYFAGLLHDVGKIGISEQPLRKPGKLTPQEWEEIKRHPVLSYRILRDIPELEEIAIITLYHHERWDGGGYPYGVSGENIPLGARILCVADSFDAMVSERVYKQAMSPEAAIRELRACGGGQFDPGVVEAFIRYLNKGNPPDGLNVVRRQAQAATI